MNKDELKIVFLGTPEFAVPSLKMLKQEGYNVIAAITQPDRPKGRGHKLVAPEVKLAAQQMGIPVIQYERISRQGVDDLKELAPDLMITVAFGQILSKEVLGIPPYGCINVHASLLPKYRGAAPIEMAVINGEARTGVTTMYTVYELDAGDMLEKDSVEIGENETGGELRERLSVLGAKTLKRTLEKLLAGTLVRTPQKEEEASYYPMFQRDFGAVDFSDLAENLANKIRGLNPAPMAYLMAGGQKVKLLMARARESMGAHAPGEILAADPKAGLVIQAGDLPLEIITLQYPGKKPMAARDFLRGNSGVFKAGETVLH